MTTSALELSGVLSFPLTPFDAEGRLDPDALGDHLEHQVDAGPGALFVACGTGEFPSLSLAEFRQVVRSARRISGGSLPVLAGVGGGLAVAREFLAAAVEERADGVLLLPPYLVRPAQAGLTEYVRHVVGGSGVPTIVYRRDNAAYDVPGTVRLLDIPEVFGLKDGVGNVEAMARIVHAVRRSGHPRYGDFLFLNGLPTAEMWALPYRSIGVPLYSSAVHCFAPDLSHRFHAALVAGDRLTYETLLGSFFVPLTQLRDEVPGYAVSLVKAAARLSGQRVGSVRPPLVDPSQEHLDRLADLLAAGRSALRAVAA